MRVTIYDIQFAELRAFTAAFPSGLWAHRKKLNYPRQTDDERIAAAQKNIYSKVHQAISSRGKPEHEPHAGRLMRVGNRYTTRYIWSNTLYIIASRMKRKEDWRDLVNTTGGGGEMHSTITKRLIRRMDKGRGCPKSARYWEKMLGGKRETI